MAFRPITQSIDTYSYLQLTTSPMTIRAILPNADLPNIGVATVYLTQSRHFTPRVVAATGVSVTVGGASTAFPGNTDIVVTCMLPSVAQSTFVDDPETGDPGGPGYFAVELASETDPRNYTNSDGYGHFLRFVLALPSISNPETLFDVGEDQPVHVDGDSFSVDATGVTIGSATTIEFFVTGNPAVFASFPADWVAFPTKPGIAVLSLPPGTYDVRITTEE